jgi:hypothetical protein
LRDGRPPPPVASFGLWLEGLPFGPGDFAGGWQWTITLAPGQATTITTSLTIVPAPGAAVAMLLGRDGWPPPSAVIGRLRSFGDVSRN